MGTSSVIDAKEPQKQNPTEKEEVCAIVFINVIFSLVNNAGVKSHNTQSSLYNISIADIVDEHVCYKSNKKLMDNPNKIFFREFYIPCEDLIFNENGICLDIDNAYSKIEYAYYEVEQYVNNLALNAESNVQICFDIIGFEAIHDIAWGFAFTADANCPYNVEDEGISNLLLEDYEPLFLEQIQNGWKVNVFYISLLDHGLIFEAIKTQELVSNTTQRDSVNQSSNTATSHNTTNTRKTINQDTRIEDKDKNATKTGFNLSSFVSFPHSIKLFACPALYVLDRLMGVDEIEDSILSNSYGAIKAFYEGDRESGKSQLKAAGVSTLNYLHKRFEVISFIPMIGAPVALIDSALYAAEENYLFFNGGDWNEVMELRNKAAISLAGAIPFFKWGKYISRSRVLNNGAAMREALNAADKGLKQAKKIRMPKATNKPKARAKSKIKNRKRTAKDNYNQAMENYQNVESEFKNSLDDVGMSYEEYVTYTRSNLYNKLKVILSNKNLPMTDFEQALLWQYINPYSTTRNGLKEIYTHINSDFNNDFQNNEL